MSVLVLALRGAAAVLVLATLAGGVPRIVQLGLAAIVGVWSALLAGGAPVPVELAVVARELVIGASIGLVAVVPILAAAMAGRIVDLAGNARGTYRGLFAILAAAVFVGIDGHVAVLTAIVDSHRELPAITAVQPRVLDALGTLVASAVGLAVPWLVTAAVVEIAVGVGARLAGRAGTALPTAAAVPAALAMMTAALVATLAVAIASLLR
jgi:flagellar biosynthesis protein FliR